MTKKSVYIKVKVNMSIDESMVDVKDTVEDILQEMDYDCVYNKEWAKIESTELTEVF